VDVEIRETARWREIAKLVDLRIRREHEKHDIAATELAAAIGTWTRTVHRWEYGDEPPSLRSLFMIAAALGCDVVDLIPRPDEHLLERHA